MTKQLDPLGDRVVVRPLKPEGVSAGGIYLPDTTKRRVCRGTVLAVGPGRRNAQGERHPLDVRKGDVVVYVEFAGSQVGEAGDEVLVVMREDEIIAREGREVPGGK